MNAELRDLLQSAKGVLVKLEWIQGAMAIGGDARKPCAVDSPAVVGVCLVGAVDYAAAIRGLRDHFVGDSALLLLRKALPPEEQGSGLADYNDAPGRTKEEILDLIDRAIEGLVEKQ